NNINVCHQAPTFFDEEEKLDCDNIVNANVTSLMSMIRTVVPQMQERQNGLIINMDSFTSMRSMPFMSVYAGTKGFVKSFTLSLAPELESDGIMVFCVLGLSDISKMFGIKTHSLTVPSAN
ncbi:hypothetical protein GGH97_004350, partial [Coemansia sp. RSA 475]